MLYAPPPPPAIIAAPPHAIDERAAIRDSSELLRREKTALAARAIFGGEPLCATSPCRLIVTGERGCESALRYSAQDPDIRRAIEMPLYAARDVSPPEHT